jgi:hypothetical protein
MVLDGAMVILACCFLTAFHPGVCFKGTWKEANFHFRAKNEKGNSEIELVKNKRGLFGRKAKNGAVVTESGA